MLRHHYSAFTVYRAARGKILLAGVGKFWLLYAGKHFNSSNCTVLHANPALILPVER